MGILPILVLFGVAIAATVWFGIVAPNRKKRERWNELVVGAARELGATPAVADFGFTGFNLETPQGPIVGFVSAGLVVERNLINSGAYRSNGSAFYTNFIFLFPQADGPKFEVGDWGAASKKLSADDVGDAEFAKRYTVAAQSGEQFRALWDEKARQLMMRSGAQYLVASGGAQIQAVRYGAPESAAEVTDMLELVQLLAAKASA